ncbi:MAG: hypothetical protein HY744_03815 [Deltaproteobacteria bacterium]|nr:hypothetical protein [Deltaproteobacteria bacterium]
MATTNPRIHTVLEPRLYEVVAILARRDGVSLSQKVCQLVRDAIELIEDTQLESFAEQRRRTFHPRQALTPAEVRRRLDVR